MNSSLPFDPLLLPTVERRLAAEVAKRKAKKEQGRRGGLIRFIRYFWDVLEPQTQFVDGWPLEAICQHLEAITFGELNPPRLLENVPPGFMKALDVDTPVLTTWGWKRHGDILPGDFVFGPDGSPKRVEAVTDQRLEAAYEVAFDDESKIVAGAGHLWEVERDFPYGGPGSTRIRHKTVVTTTELIPSTRGRGTQRPDRIEVCRPIQFPPRRFLIDPYLLGAWLGDGATNSGVIYTAEQDREHFEKLGRITSTTSGTNGRQDFHRIGIDGFQTKLRVAGLLGNKHIPPDYLESSVEQRTALLQGLMDTDGTVDKVRGSCMFTTKLAHLANELVSLLSSLGIKANAKESWSTIAGQKFGPYWQVSFTAPVGMRIFRLDRKQSRVQAAVSKRASGRYVKSIREVGERLVSCLQVEGSLYLAGTRFVTTHNSLVTNVFWPAWEWGPIDRPHLRYVAFSYASTLTLRDNRRFLALLQSQKYQELYADRFTLLKVGEELVSNDKTGWKLASSVGGVGTGERGNRVLVDDPHNVKEQESEVIRTGTVNWFQESIQSRLNDLKKDAIIVIMQRVHEADVSGAIIREMPEYEHLCIPIEYDPLRHCETKIGWSDPRTEEDELAWPERFGEDELQVFKRKPYLWAGQYQQTPRSRKGAIIQRDHWMTWDAEAAREHGVQVGEDGEPRYPEFEFVVASADTAYTEKEENDPTGFTIWGVFRDKADQPKALLMWAWAKHKELHGQLPPKQPNESKREYDLRCMRMDAWGIVEWIAYSCRRFRVDKLLIEAKASGITVAQEMQRLHREDGWSVELIKPLGDKVARTHSVEPAFAAGLVYAPDTTWADKVIDEAEVFPKGEHDDLVDSATQALSWLRRNGLIAHNFEIAAELREAMEHKPQARALYDV
ncbi:phage terminase large subunit [Bradyrhizobium genosp. L]|uniref:phage terminase large subunit n=1 Tax=Bradyrhizobium genosp. L TaxID=83637 RepID=UPI001FEEACEE|nr:phage terminase large subunit [Bradyrhizobium genosp. L]